jgi:glyoxylase-like metal-dependent hydrolase (beta-lactamase superfamily II)
VASTRAPLARFETASGARVYRIPVETFPGHVNNVYLVLDRDASTLVDVGSGLPGAVEDLHAGLAAIRTRFGERVGLEAVQHVVITHAHIDHFGYVGWFQAHTSAALYVHELDARVLSNFEERIVLASKDVRVFLERAGLAPAAREELEEMYRAGKSFFKSVPPDRKLRDGDRLVNGYVAHHVPGHCPGQVCLQVDDVLFTADHVLARITPRQSPAAITPGCGLELYLQSLAKIRGLDGIRLALPGHEAEILDLRSRIDAIVAHHHQRLERVLAICATPRTLAEVSRALFGERGGYTRLLALEEAGAHVEYLFQRGELGIANLRDVESEPNPVIRYERRRHG